MSNSNVIYPQGVKPPWQHSNRGVHLLPAAHHNGWLGNKDQRNYWLSLLKRMHVSWVLMITSGDSCLEVFDGKEAVRWLLDNQIVPTIRDLAVIDKGFKNGDTVRRLVAIYDDYGIKPIFIWANEPGDDREWTNKNRPDNWREVFINKWKDAVGSIIIAGATPGFPDPLADWEWWFSQMLDIKTLWRLGYLCFTAHLYGLGRPLDYPEDDISCLGLPATEEEYAFALDDLKDHPHFRDLPLEWMNKSRHDLADPGMTYLDDSSCFGAWRNIRHAAKKVFGFDIPIAMTEGGFTPRDRPYKDDRWFHTTPKMVARRTLEMFEREDHGIFGMTPWILADSHMGGAGGWYTECMAGGAYSDVIDLDTGIPYGFEKPVIRMLEKYPPGLYVPPDTTIPPPEPEPEPIDPPIIKYKITYGVGAMMIIGDLGRRDVKISASDPWGNTWHTVSGDKPEFGTVGGFSMWAPHNATYKIAFEDQKIDVPMKVGQTAFLSAST